MKQNTDTFKKNLSKELEIISITLINQFTCIEELISDGWQNSVYNQLAENEKMIDEQENSFIKNAAVQLTIMSNKVPLVRKMASTHQAVLFMEIISELLIDMADMLKKIDLTKPEYAEFKRNLQDTFTLLKTIVHTVVFSFIKEDIKLTYPVNEKNREIDSLVQQTMNNLLESYHSISLDTEELQCVLCQSHILCIIQKIQKFTISIAKLIIFVTEGPDIRPQRF